MVSTVVRFFFYTPFLKVLLRVRCKKMKLGSKEEKVGDQRKSETKPEVK